MKNLYILQTTEEDYIRKLDKNDSDIVSFDYTSHMELVKKKISNKFVLILMNLKIIDILVSHTMKD